MCEEFKIRSYNIITDGTDNHLFLLDLKNKGISGARAEKILEYVNIYVNKNTIPGDVSALNPSGIRIGTPAITTLGIKDDDIIEIVYFIDTALNIGKSIIEKYNPSNLNEFVNFFDKEDKLKELKFSVKMFMKQF
jgi:glycine hydroxymethyltransferase